ncbi:MAG: hypothetical protein Q7V58_01080 [Actinomycetota bacterium]|nr:hypothetical protein [Actinomycetota bacterium]
MLMVLAGLPSVGEIHLDRVFAAEVADVVFDGDDEWMAVQPLSVR